MVSSNVVEVDKPTSSDCFGYHIFGLTHADYQEQISNSTIAAPNSEWLLTEVRHGGATESIIVGAILGSREDTYVTMGPVLPELSTLGLQFQGLANWWRAETGGFSSIDRKAMHPAYQQIIGLGPQIIPTILRELRSTPDHWFWALRALTSVNPVPEEDAGRFEAMAAAWLSWGKDHGYID